MLANAMPIYVFRCTACGREVEEIQKYTDPPPVSEDLCSGAPADSEASRDQEIERLEKRETCNFERVPTTASQRWPGDHNNDGRAGWVRQKDGVTMVRVQQGRNSTKYGEGSV